MPDARSIRYSSDLAALTPARLDGGFFDGWPVRPSPERHLAQLRGSELAIVAIDAAAPGEPVVGFVTAIGDGALTAFIPSLEVLPAWRGRGIGSELMRRILAQLAGRYSVDLVCDPELVPFYERLGGTPWRAVSWRNRHALERAGDGPPDTVTTRGTRR